MQEKKKSGKEALTGCWLDDDFSKQFIRVQFACLK